MFHFLNFYRSCENLRIFEEIIPVKCYENSQQFKHFNIIFVY